MLDNGTLKMEQAVVQVVLLTALAVMYTEGAERHEKYQVESATQGKVKASIIVKRLVSLRENLRPFS